MKAVWVTAGGIKKFDKVPAGWYVIRETKAPTEDGYATCADKVVYVGNDETIAPGGKMTISGDETVYYSFSYDKDGVTIANVAKYEYNTKNGKVALYDKPITVELSKIDSATEKELPGAVLTLYRMDNDGDTKIETWTSTSESHVIKYLTPGRYKLHEDTVPLGYYTTQNTIEFDVYDSEEIQKCVMINHPIEVNINKVGEEAVLNNKGEYEYVEKPLKGVLFGIYAKDAIKDYSGKEIAAADTCVGYAVTDSNGVASCDSKLVRGEYYYKELKTAGPQYVMDEDLHPFTLILANSKISTFNVNETLPIKNVLARGNIKVLKVNKDGRAPLAGAEFDVFNADGKIVDHLVTGTDGTATTKVLPYGKYSLRETKAPTGFVLSKATFDTEIIANGDVPLLEITNSTITKLGSKGIFIVVGLAVIFAGLVTVICFKLRRK